MHQAHIKERITIAQTGMPILQFVEFFNVLRREVSVEHHFGHQENSIVILVVDRTVVQNIKGNIKFAFLHIELT